MKKFFLALSMLYVVTFINCGGGSSTEAKELLEKILRVVGIPYNIVMNICQDGNGNGICEDFELQTKVTLNSGDTLMDIWTKITLTDDGQYFLQTRDPALPILLELQDGDHVYYDEGRFTIPFEGFKRYEQNETKELSILSAMVDKDYFMDSDLVGIRNLDNPDVQDKFYQRLFEALEENLNTLRGVDFGAQESMIANLSEMATRLLDNGVTDTLPYELNQCGTDMGCVDSRLELLYRTLLISEEEARSIKESYPTQEGIQKESIVGSWYMGDATQEDNIVVLTFFGNGSYLLLQDGKTPDEDCTQEDCHDGIERGVYTLDSDGRLKVDVQTDTNGEWGLSHSSITLEVENNQLIMHERDEVYSAQRVENIEDSIVGSWYSGDATQEDNIILLIFFDNGTYVLLQDGKSPSEGCSLADCHDGMERGEYRIDSDGNLRVNVQTDTNGEWGLSHSDMSVQVDNNTLVMKEDGEIVLQALRIN